MIRPIFTLLFSLSALTGLGLIVYGMRLKSSRSGQTSVSDDDIVLEFSGAAEMDSEILELEKNSTGMEIDEKKHFDPGKHHPERIASRKPDGEPGQSE